MVGFLNPWLIGALGLFLIWILIFIFGESLRKEMLFAGFITLPLGLTEPLFVPTYWNPPSLFNLATNTGFDIESLIFSFSVGGIASVLYELIFKTRHKQIKNKKMHEFHKLALISPLIAFVLSFIFLKINIIYIVIISLFIGAIMTILCRPDLKKKMLIGGVLFLAFYFLFFSLLNIFYPGWVSQIWNLPAISGILILNVPLEELLFALSAGMFWSSLYEHIKWYR